MVTGASSGIGYHLCHRLAEHGFKIVLVARNREALADLASKLGARYGTETLLLCQDLSRPGSVDELLEQTKELDLGLVVNNAGVGTSGPFLQSHRDREQDMLHLNVVSVMESVHGFGQRLKARGRGAMVLVASVLGYQGVPYSANYAATKAYVLSLGEALQKEWEKDGLDLLLVAPGPTGTGFAKAAGLRFARAASVETVVDSIMNSLGKSKTIVPDPFGKFLRFTSAWMGRTFASTVIGKEMRKMSGSGP